MTTTGETGWRALRRGLALGVAGLVAAVLITAVLLHTHLDAPWQIPAADGPAPAAVVAGEARTAETPAPDPASPGPPPPPQPTRLQGTMLAGWGGAWTTPAPVLVLDGPGPFAAIEPDLRPEDRIDDLTRRLDGMSAILRELVRDRVVVRDVDRLAQGLEHVALRMLAVELAADRRARRRVKSATSAR